MARDDVSWLRIGVDSCLICSYSLGSVSMALDISRHTRPSLLMRLRQPDDSAAWAEFVGLYGPVIAGWCKRRDLQPSDADDVVQTVLLRLARRMQTFFYDPAQGSFRAYLHTLSKYAVNDFYADQKERGSGDTKVLASLESVTARDDLLSRLDETFDHELLAEALVRVRRRVEENTWEAFELTAVQGVATTEAATRLEMSIAGVYKAKSRMVKLLREELALLDSDSESLARVNTMLCDT